MTESSIPATASSRHWLYGFNVVLIGLIALAIVGLTDYYTNKFSWLFDWSTGALNSLSPRSVKLVQAVDRKIDQRAAALRKAGKPVPERDKSYQLVNLFAHGAPDQDGRDRAQQVDDLLDNYAQASRHIVVTKFPHPEDLSAAIRDRYQGELAPYEDAVRDSKPVVDRLAAFYKNQAAEVGAYAVSAKLAGADLARAEEIQGDFSTGIERNAHALQDEIKRLTDNTEPQWGDAVTKIKNFMAKRIGEFKSLQTLDVQDIGKPMLDYLKQHAADFQKALADVQAYEDKLDKLQPLKVDDVLNALGANTVVVLGPDGARAIDSYAMYKANQAAPDSPGAPKATFQGEQAVTSALLAMSEPDKRKVVFVTSSPQSLTTSGPYSDIADELKNANFDVLEWSPPGAQANPEAPPPPAEPPAQGKGVVWIVFPPDAPNQQMMMMGAPPPNPKPLVDAVRKHLDAGGNVLFLAEASSPMAMMGGGAAGYAFADAVKPFGIDVKSTYSVVTRMGGGSGEAPQVAPIVWLSRYPDTVITTPMQSLQTILPAQQSRFGAQAMPTVVDVAASVPAGVKALVILRTPVSDNVWGESSYTTSADTTFNPQEDLPSPLAMGVASTNAAGQKVVVIGSKYFASNDLLEAVVPVQASSGTVYAAKVCPGNLELMINCVQWLANNENMIAVSPQANVALRIEAMSPAKEAMFRWGAVVVPPVLALGMGILVFWSRRR